ncbi:MAG: hypothetical protein ACTSPX_03195 [Candidatus Thorarchaeota archaeon]
MLQFELPELPGFPTLFLPFAIIFIIFSLMAFGWMVIHVEHSRHFSKAKVFMSGAIGSVFMGLGLHMLLLWLGT